MLKGYFRFTLLDKKRNEDILRMTGQPPIEIELRKVNDDCNGLDMCKGWVVRGHKREFLDVDQWGRKDNLGVSLRWVDTISRDLSWTQLEDRTYVVTDRRT